MPFLTKLQALVRVEPGTTVSKSNALGVLGNILIQVNIFQNLQHLFYYKIKWRKFEHIDRIIMTLSGKAISLFIYLCPSLGHK